jgi:uncharacterized protein YndB with AHSA1/START domain
MIQLEKRIIIHRPVEEVFAFLEDLTNVPRWQEAVEEARQVTGDPIGVGTQYTSARMMMGQRFEASIEYIEHEPDKKIVFKSTSGPVSFQAAYLTEPLAEGTQVTALLDLQMEGLPTQVEAEMHAAVSSEADTELGKLKMLLESRANSAHAS